ncbi:alpha/beta fold hydrolase [Nocardioides aurantiacus]|uniref:Alpha-beta hydrolase superfamily lysophospholipase n=1 Tax=Nocardioides aurantiacus TaxID=86796 RepID=A0A3N2CU25_9ACTN|nr:alpha/beta fold hydrolase [Nocardioides aurantiacus]ROR91042.1 alpha-beta hydrolase superfamily lysophospholipase [Nocardioides aurantiacus]
MRLHTRSWGSGDQVAVLLHGMFGESRQFWEVGPALAERGYRAVAVDLPGHGLSGPCLEGGLHALADAVIASVPHAPELVLGHSLGALVAAVGREALAPRRAVYVDVGFQRTAPSGGGLDAASLRAAFEDMKRTRTVEWLSRTRPWWKPMDWQVEAEAARRFDVGTAVAVNVQTPHWSVGPPDVSVPSLLIHADPSDHVSDEELQALRMHGLSTRAVRGAGHSVWYGFFEEFMSAFDDWSDGLDA